MLPVQSYITSQAGGRWIEEWRNDYCQGKTEQIAVKPEVQIQHLLFEAS